MPLFHTVTPVSTDHDDDNPHFFRSSTKSSLSSLCSNDTDNVSSSVSTAYHPSAKSRPLIFAFWFVSFAYMLPWTALGSLISYYKYHYSAHFYVKIYCAYYLLGLPVALLQFRFDEWVDRRAGSSAAFLTRGVLGYLCQVVVQVGLLFTTTSSASTETVLLFALLGMVSWWLHGTASVMTALFPQAMIAYLQIGFRSPELFTVVVDSLWALGKYATEAHIRLLLQTNCLIALLAMVNWVVLVRSDCAQRYFENRDERMEEEARKQSRHAYQSIGTTGGSADDDDEESSSLLERRPQRPRQGQRQPSGRYEGGEDKEDEDELEREWRAVVPLLSPSSSLSPLTLSPTSLLSSNSSSSSPSSLSPMNSHNDSQRKSATISFRPTTSLSSPALQSLSSSDKQQQQQQYQQHHHQQQQQQQPLLLVLHEAHDRLKAFLIGPDGEEEMFFAICVLSVALFVTMWSSIFQASFFAYVNSTSGRDIEQILYFTRLFCDLIGRPLTFFPRPVWFQVSHFCVCTWFVCA
jgi:hypothetical protein